MVSSLSRASLQCKGAQGQWGGEERGVGSAIGEREGRGGARRAGQGEREREREKATHGKAAVEGAMGSWYLYTACASARDHLASSAASSKLCLRPCSLHSEINCAAARVRGGARGVREGGRGEARRAKSWRARGACRKAARGAPGTPRRCRAAAAAAAAVAEGATHWVGGGVRVPLVGGQASGAAHGHDNVGQHQAAKGQHARNHHGRLLVKEVAKGRHASDPGEGAGQAARRTRRMGAKLAAPKRRHGRERRKKDELCSSSPGPQGRSSALRCWVASRHAMRTTSR